MTQPSFGVSAFVGASAAVLGIFVMSLVPGASSALTASPGRPESIAIEINVENITTYIGDAEYAKLGTNPERTQAQPKAFSTLFAIGDIVGFNGQPARGTWTAFAALTLLAPVKAPGLALADTLRGGPVMANWEILHLDGRPLGTLVGAGLAGGPSSANAFSPLRWGNVAITGGTGEFVEARGVIGETTDPLASFRFASTSEDPSQRRTHGGGRLTFVATITR